MHLPERFLPSFDHLIEADIVVFVSFRDKDTKHPTYKINRKK